MLHIVGKMPRRGYLPEVSCSCPFSRATMNEAISRQLSVARENGQEASNCMIYSQEQLCLKNFSLPSVDVYQIEGRRVESDGKERTTSFYRAESDNRWLTYNSSVE